MPSSSQAPSNLAHNRENRLQSDLCFLMRLGSYTQPSFPVIMAIPVWTQSAQAAAAVCWKCRIHVLKKTLCGNALCAELRNFKSGDMFFSFSSLLQFPRLCFGDEWVWDCNALSSQKLQWVKKKKKKILPTVFSFSLGSSGPLCAGAFITFSFHKPLPNNIQRCKKKKKNHNMHRLC